MVQSCGENGEGVGIRSVGGPRKSWIDAVNALLEHEALLKEGVVDFFLMTDIFLNS